MLDLNDYLKERKAMVDEALERFLPPASDVPNVLHEAIRYSALDGGKRLRPVLTLAACEAVGEAIETALPAACAIECIHCFSLIHDDLPCMDDDDFRRGRPTSHKTYGEATALLAGDALLSLAFELVAQTPLNDKNKVLQTVQLLARATGTGGMIGGQVLDMQAQGRQVTRDDVEQIHRWKTGALLEASVVVGAMLGGGTDGQIEAMSAYGRHIGLAFQVADDLLDLRGDSEKLGKSTGSDLRMQKATYPSVIGVEASEELARQAMKDAVDALSGFDNRAEPLRLLARFIVDRDT